jgi:membrane protease YdiL (CAAX protease family)
MKRNNKAASVVRIALFMFLCAVVLATIAPLPRRSSASVQMIVIGGATALGAYALTALFTRWERISLRDVGAMPNSNTVIRLGLGFALGSVIVAIHAAIVFLSGHIQYQLSPGFDMSLVPVFLFGYLVLACREELAFHGYPLRKLNSMYGLYVAQLVIASVFAAEHMLGGYSLANALFGAAVGSLLFGMASLATRGLAVPIGLHTAWNFGQWILGGKETPGVYTPVVPEGFRASVDRTGMLGYLGVMAVATFLFWLWNRRTVPVA